MFWSYALKHSCCHHVCLSVHRSISLSVGLRVDYYKVLGVSSSASDEEIKKAYLRKCKKYHPDRHQGSKEMQEKFVQVAEAYNVLSNAAERKEHDNKTRWPGSRPQSPYGWGKGPRSTPEDIFKQYQRSNDRHFYEDYETKTQFYRSKQANRDRMSDYWDFVYRQQNTTRDNFQFGRSNPFQKPNFNQTPSNEEMVKMEHTYVFIFLCSLILIIFIRVVIARSAMQHNSSIHDPNFYSTLPTKPTTQKPSKDFDEQNLKTEEA